jgi:hypothetical protein
MNRHSKGVKSAVWFLCSRRTSRESQFESDQKRGQSPDWCEVLFFEPMLLLHRHLAKKNPKMEGQVFNFAVSDLTV